MSQGKLNSILAQIFAKAHALFDKKLASVILFGSCARGDYDAESLDIAPLLHCDREEIRDYAAGRGCSKACQRDKNPYRTDDFKPILDRIKLLGGQLYETWRCGLA